MKQNTFILFVSVILSIYSLQCFANNDNKTLIIFSANWCKYCQIAKHDINSDPELSETIKKYEVIFIDYDKDKEIVEGYRVKSIPAFIIYNNGKEQKRLNGYKNSKQLNSFLK